jgi:hypothetical protein
LLADRATYPKHELCEMSNSQLVLSTPPRWLIKVSVCAVQIKKRMEVLLEIASIPESIPEAEDGESSELPQRLFHAVASKLWAWFGGKEYTALHPDLVQFRLPNSASTNDVATKVYKCVVCWSSHETESPLHLFSEEAWHGTFSWTRTAGEAANAHAQQTHVGEIEIALYDPR